MNERMFNDTPARKQIGYWVSEQGRERERNVLFNDALNTFYLRLYGVRHMVKDHSDSEKGNPLSPHRLLLSINSWVYTCNEGKSLFSEALRHMVKDDIIR